jgi:hypothetical protein
LKGNIIWGRISISIGEWFDEEDIGMGDYWGFVFWGWGGGWEF